MLASAVTKSRWQSARPLDFSKKLSPSDLQVMDFLAFLSDDYPNITEWFVTKVIPGQEIGERKISIVWRHDCIAAVGIAKRTTEEEKICTVRVGHEYEGYGLGVRMFDTLLCWLGNTKPHLTVSKNKFFKFERIFDRFGFELTSTSNGLYRPDIVEYLFNENSKLGSPNL